jgi:RNA polymerase sigma-70 factor (ECF subfamily)
MTDERQIVALYDRLFQIQPSLVVELNRAVAIAMRDGPEAGLTHIDAVLEYRGLVNYYLAHSARADVYRRLGRKAKARSSYEKVLALTQQDPARQFLGMRIRPLKYIDTSGTGAGTPGLAEGSSSLAKVRQPITRSKALSEAQSCN